MINMAWSVYEALLSADVLRWYKQGRLTPASMGFYLIDFKHIQGKTRDIKEHNKQTTTCDPEQIETSLMSVTMSALFYYLPWGVPRGMSESKLFTEQDFF